MKALVFRGERQLAIEDVDDVMPGPGELLIEVAYCGVCGSDLHGFLGHSARRTRSVPLVMGHEFSGRIVGRGAGTTDTLAIGQRVCVQPVIACGTCPACRAGKSHICPRMSLIGIERAGAFARYVAVPADRAFPLPDNLSDEAATLAETLAVEVHLFRKMVPAFLRNIVILGAGAQGVLAVQLARLMSIPEIIVSDISNTRLEIARQLGATTTLNARQTDVAANIKSLTANWGADFIVETTGSPAARREGLAALAIGGTMGLVGLGDGTTTVDFLPIVAKEQDVRGSYCYSDDEFLRAMDLLSSGQVRSKEMLSVMPLADGHQVFTSLVDGTSDGLKVLLQPA